MGTCHRTPGRYVAAEKILGRGDRSAAHQSARMSEEPAAKAGAGNSRSGSSLGWAAVVWFAWQERNAVALGTFAFVAFVTVLFLVGRGRK